jgi:CRP-like cAMP-binding protein
MKKRRYGPTEEIIRQGDIGDSFFLIGEGEVEVMRADGAAKPSAVARLGPGSFFGERALITDEPRNATIVALENVYVYTLAKKDFRAALDASASFREQVQRVYFNRQ